MSSNPNPINLKKDDKRGGLSRLAFAWMIMANAIVGIIVILGVVAQITLEEGRVMTGEWWVVAFFLIVWYLSVRPLTKKALGWGKK